MITRYFSFVVTAIATLLYPVKDVQAYFASVKAWGMGGCGVANPQDALAAAYNPAGMVWVGTRADLGAHWRYQNANIDVTDDTLGASGTYSANRGQNFGTPDFGFNWMVFDSCDVSIGCVAYTRDFFKASYSSGLPVFGTSPMSMELWQGVISPCFSMRFERFSCGITADFIGQRLKVRGLENFDNAIFSASPGNVTNRKDSFTQGITYTLGAMYKWTNCLTIGGIWQLHAKAHHFRKYRGLVSENGELEIPTRIRGGLYWRFAPCYGLALDVEHIAWNKVRWWHHGFPADSATLTEYPFGSAKGPGFGWEDQTFFSVGGDIQLSQAVTFRLGYRYGRSPVKKTETLMNILTMNIIEQDVTIGCTVDMGYSGQFSGYYAYSIPRKRNGVPIGTDFGGGTYDLNAERHAAGFSLGWGW